MDWTMDKPTPKSLNTESILLENSIYIYIFFLTNKKQCTHMQVVTVTIFGKGSSKLVSKDNDMP